LRRSVLGRGEVVVKKKEEKERKKLSKEIERENGWMD